MFDIIGRGSKAQGIATVPEFLWELCLGVYLTVKGFKASPILTDGSEVVVPDDRSHPVIVRPPGPAVVAR